MTWLGVKSKHFGVGEYRRHLYGSKVSADTFDPGNSATEKLRRKANEECLNDMIDFLTKQGGQVGIYDASNLVATERRELYNKLFEIGIHPLFIEYICDKQEVVEDNIRKVKVISPDYVSWDKEKAFEDFKEKIKRMEPLYQTIEDIDLPFVKLYNVGDRIIVNQINGYLQTRIVFYLMNLHISNRTIYLARSGQSVREDSYKADAQLSEEGIKYSKALYKAVTKRINETQGSQKTNEASKLPSALKVWTSARLKCSQTTEYFKQDPNAVVRQRMLLKGLNPGLCESLDMDQIKEQFPKEYEHFIKNPYTHRFPRAESYHDVAVRLEAVILELEREKNDVIIIAPESVLRCIYAYFAPNPVPKNEIPNLKFPRTTFMEITPTAYGCKNTILDIDVDGISIED
ncbi:hypothetical protein H4219_001338 [Mycoemilia scoparia]|uniref:6-phosphofructo-2-kinase domain-containing protein n=1 Tax=Mycoemilia scoparia TaxID=417184 RepID=A0A9W8DQG0_9FUNG|nr:hypothetical protein H4219_001338 [Mycoemilia scoparia]